MLPLWEDDAKSPGYIRFPPMCFLYHTSHYYICSPLISLCPCFLGAQYSVASMLEIFNKMLNEGMSELQLNHGLLIHTLLFFF